MFIVMLQSVSECGNVLCTVVTLVFTFELFVLMIAKLKYLLSYFLT